MSYTYRSVNLHGFRTGGVVVGSGLKTGGVEGFVLKVQQTEARCTVLKVSSLEFVFNYT